MELISADNGMSPTWSPDGQQIAFLSNRAEGWDLYLMPAAGGPATRLSSGATADDPAWSPDGHWIAVERNHRIEAISASERTFHTLVEGGSHPSWSPDGRLAFVRNRDLYVLEPVREPGLKTGLEPAPKPAPEPGGHEHLLLRDADQPSWSPGGDSISFVRHGIWTLDLQTMIARPRTHDASDQSPSVAADGDVIFARHDALVIVHPDGSLSLLPHLPNPAGAPIAHPTNLDQIAFHLHDGGNWDIATASLEHGNVQRITRSSWTSWNARL